MNLKDVDLVKLSKLISQQIDHVTCLECCKYYIAPETATCGHTLCHSCWRNRRTCPYCTKPFERCNLRHNLPIQKLSEHIRELGKAFENLFKIKLDEFLLVTGEVESENDPTKNVKDWLASSQNHFSAPAQSSELSSQEIHQHPNPLNVSMQIHTNTPKNKSPEKLVLAPIPQDDWDKIEPMPDTEDINKNKENVIGPMDIEPFYFDDIEYTANHPRRSSRKREAKPTNVNNKTNENNKTYENNSLEKHSSKDSSGETDKKSNKTKQTWNNVKRMRKEFSKLNKKNRNKLNVSIEMCKKTQSTAKKNVVHQNPQANTPQVYEIDENTPNQLNIDKEVSKENNNEVKENNLKGNASPMPKFSISTSSESKSIQELNKPEALQNLNNKQAKNHIQESNAKSVHSSKHEEPNVTDKVVKMPFYKRSALYSKCEESTIKTINHNIDSNTTANDDIEITIKVGNTITNIFIKKKNDIELKLNTDREIQTSLGAYNKIEDANKPSLQNMNTQNIIINVEDNHNVNVDHKSKTKPRVEELKKVTASENACVSGKKNTDSADTATAQFEITESVEKELSKVMECEEEVHEPVKSKSIPIIEKQSQKNKPQKTATNPDDLEYLNDLDIFESGSVKESNVQLLKNTEHAPSEILLCTVKTKNKTQNVTEKRGREINDEDILPISKRAKLGENSLAANETIELNRSKINQSESEPIIYDAIMGTVFANIDADIEEIRQSQNIDKNNYTLTGNHKKNELNKEKESQINKHKDDSMNQINDYCNQKDSENIFSVCVEKDNENIQTTLTNEKVPPNVLKTNIEDFLTPVMCRNLESSGEVIVLDNNVEMVNDDSDRSVVEETPQKITSFSKLKSKSNDLNQSQKVEQLMQRVSSDKRSSESANTKSIVDLVHTSTEIKRNQDVTVIDMVDKKALETPLTINKFCDQIKHKSTPVARKSLNFETQNKDDLDPEQTLCPTNDVAKTSQEKEFMSKAFEKTPTTPALRPLGAIRPLAPRNLGLKNRKVCIAGSCLTTAETAKLKLLCARNKWTYTDKYSNEITHLVVGVDEENRSQRSVKYMCALASSKWIISYEWVEKCLQSKDVVGEEHFEALDSTGEPGPMRSRIAKKKLFQGITFFCMEPFSVLDVDTLKGMLEASGGRVVKEAKEVRITDNTAPALLLAEPENTQEDRFIYLAMELSIVPVNYEWVLNCLGCYTLGSVQELLLCPSSLLPKATEKWPQELIARDED